LFKTDELLSSACNQLVDLREDLVSTQKILDEIEIEASYPSTLTFS